MSILPLLPGLALLLVSFRLLVWGAVGIAHAFGISDLVIGLTIVTVGTSLPKLAASVAAARKREQDIAVDNVVGFFLMLRRRQRYDDLPGGKPRCQTVSAYGLFLAGAMLARHGFHQEVSQQRQRFQTTSRLPFKALGGLTVALATTLTAWAGVGHGLPIALAFGAGAFAAFVLLYGLDPRRQSAVAKIHEGSAESATKALQQAERKILAIEQARGRIMQPELNQRLTRIIALARAILEEIARDPRDLRRARKFLNTYLDGAQRVVTGYAEAHANGRTQPLEANFRRVLATIEEVFGQQHQHLLENDLRDLDVQMEVLETQLKREGLN